MLDRLNRKLQIGDKVIYAHSFDGVGLYEGKVIQLYSHYKTPCVGIRRNDHGYEDKTKSTNVLIITPETFPELFI